MRRTFLGLAAAAALLALLPARTAHAQFNNDVFGFYYGYYLPNAQAQSMRPTPMDTLNQNAAQRQYAAVTDRTALYDPISPYQDNDDDGSTRFGRRGNNAAGTPLQPRGFALSTTKANTGGDGPPGFYNRTARYFPGLKPGRGPNQNLAKVRSGRGGGMGMPSMGGGMGMPGPR